MRLHWASASVLLLATGCGGSDPSSGAPSGPPPAVEAVQARVGALPLVERLSGVARAADQVELRTEIAGIVDAVFVQSGDAVRRGQPLVRLRAETQGEQLAQAEAAPAEERARVEQARATLEERRAALDRTVVRAPVDGHVGRRLVEPGARVDPDTLLFVLGNLDRLIVEVPLTEAMLAYLDEGDPVRMTSRAIGDAVLEGSLSRIPPFLAEGSFSTVGEIDVANAGGPLRPGMFVNVDVLYGESRSATLVPVGAVWEEPKTGEWSVYVVRPEAADVRALETATELSDRPLPVERRPVDLVAEGRDSFGVTGVEEGEWVVTVGQHLLAEEGVEAARVRPTTWERVTALQSLQREDLLERFLEKQRRNARERGATPTPSSEYVGPDAAARQAS